MAKCKFCGKEIMWTKEGRKNVPVEGDGGLHRCDEMLGAMKSIKSIERESLSSEEIKKYEEAINNSIKK